MSKLDFLTTGSYDFDIDWYRCQGKILINSMFMWSVWPIVDLLLSWLEFKILRTYDSWGSKDGAPMTRKKSI